MNSVANGKLYRNTPFKRRESLRPFAPFAPSMLREAVPAWFETDDDVPFMMQVYPIRPEKRAQIPAVTHVDGSGRLQTVTRESNPRYDALIEAFRELTGVPAQHLVQRERAGGMQARGGAGLLPAHADGCAGDGGVVHSADPVF